MEYKYEHETFNNADSNDDLFARYSKNRDVVIRNEIVKRYLYLAEIISKKFINRGVEYDDIHQVASLALIKAVERFSPDKGFKFASFATPTIVGEIKRYFRDKSSSIRIPRRIYEEYHKVNSARDHLIQQLGRTPRADEIAGYLGIGEEAVLEILESWNAYNIQSLDQMLRRNLYA
jgi:RNA polymerase sigma-B factor